MIRFVDLFAGIGGIRLGAEQALNSLGYSPFCVLSSEIDEKACETYQSNYQEYPKGDIKKISIIRPFDFLLAGFPCQPFSYAGKHQGFGDTRGTLFFEIERILESYHPTAFLLENVRGLKTHDKGRTFETIINRLHELGYGTCDLLLNSSDFGVPQNRVRLYILGIHGATPKMSLVTDLGAADSHKFKEMSQQIAIFPQRKQKLIKDILEYNVSDHYRCSKEFAEQLRSAVGEDLTKLHGYRLIDYRGGKSLHSWEIGRKGICSEDEILFMNMLIQNRRKHSFGTDKDGKKLTIEQIQTFYKKDNIIDVIASLKEKGYLKEENGMFNPVCGNMSFEVFKFLDPDSIAITLTSSDANRLGIIDNNYPRRITPRECARIQGFPDSFKLHPNDGFAYKQLGNSVSVPVINAVITDFIRQNQRELDW